MPEQLTADSIDLSTLEFWAQPAEVRDEAFSLLRREQPDLAPAAAGGHPRVCRSSARSGTGRSSATTTSAGSRATRRRFCSGQGVLFGDAPPEMLEASQSFLAMDAPRHTKLRGLVSAAFTPRQVARIEDGIRANARRIVDEAAPTGGGDFVELVAKRLPLHDDLRHDRRPRRRPRAVVEAADALVTAADPRGPRRPRPARGPRRGAVDAAPSSPPSWPPTARAIPATT